MAAQVEEAIKFRHILIPDEFVSMDDQGRRYGGDLRIGDLTGDGDVDFVVYQCLGGLKPSFIGAFNLAGDPLWSFGDHDASAFDEDGDGRLLTVSPDRPGPVVVADIDGDGETEVLCFFIDEGVERTSKWHLHDVRLLLLDGSTGQIKTEASPAALRACDAFVDGEVQIPNYVHQRLMVADLGASPGTAMDVVVKVGKTVVALDHALNVLWTYDNPWNHYPKHSAYIPCVGDLDGDGYDEIVGGHFGLDHDGTLLWERYLGDNMDSVLVVPWNAEVGNPQAVLSAGGQILDGRGEKIFELGMDIVPHGQEVRCGAFHGPGKGLEMVIRYNGHHTDLIVVDHDGQICSRFQVDESPNNTGLETIHWRHTGEPDLIFTPSALWGGDGQRAVRFPDLPPPAGGKMGWYHCFPADVCGDERDEVILYDPYQDSVHIYTPAPLNPAAFTGYRHTDRQMNTRLID